MPRKGAPPSDFAQRPYRGWHGGPLAALGPGTMRCVAATHVVPLRHYPAPPAWARGPGSLHEAILGILSGSGCLKTPDMRRSIPRQGRWAWVTSSGKAGLRKGGASVPPLAFFPAVEQGSAGVPGGRGGEGQRREGLGLPAAMWPVCGASARPCPLEQRLLGQCSRPMGRRHFALSAFSPFLWQWRLEEKIS